MLVLTQLAVGAFVSDLVLRPGGAFHPLVAVAAGLVAIGASTLHLGRPQYAYRAVIGLRHSWLSREVVAFGAFTGLAALHAAGAWPGAVGWTAAACGLFGVACSVLIYTTTRRASWRPSVVTAKFVLTMLLGGLATVLWATALTGTRHAAVLPWVLSVALAMKLAAEATGARRVHPDVRRTVAWRFACGALALALVPAAAAVPLLWTVVLVALMTGEYLERSLFFTTAGPPR
jgi:DMSO reductase anchor subunit